jgi:EPS-associated MarR family transcriptional regulator
VKNKITEDSLDILHLIQENPNTSQRELAKKTGLSIGKINYCLKSLVDIGFIKMKNFNNANNKIQYSYILTIKGIIEKVKITKSFIDKKQLEYDKLISYIDK